MTKSKTIEGLNCDTAARQGVAVVLLVKLDEMCSLRDAALDFSDIEGVHKMRVASRRLRSALRDFQPYLSKTVSPKRLKAVAGALGAVRDEDVTIAMMEKLVPAAGRDAKEGLERLAGERRERREEARAALGAAISPAAIGELREKFTTQLRRAAAASTKGRGGALQGAARFSEAGGEIIRARFRELRDAGGSLYRPYGVDAIHEMRIRAKRLRYSIELFTQCWGEPLAPHAAEVEKMQEHLGDLHDCDVWSADLGARLTRRRRPGHDVEQATLRADQAAERRAAVWLLRRLARERAVHYNRALTLWDRWEVTNFTAGFSGAIADTRARLGGGAPADSESKADSAATAQVGTSDAPAAFPCA